MKAAIIELPHVAHVDDVEDPVLAPNEVCIEVRSAGICGTDLHIFKGEYHARYPLIPGHEFSGVVASIGTEVTNFHPGDRVTADPNLSCNKCYFCQQKMPNQCINHGAIGVTQAGGFAQYVIAPESNVYAIGDIPFTSAALIEPLACVMWGIQRVDIRPGASALIFGAGPMGCMLVQTIRNIGAVRITTIDLSQRRLDMAYQLGATDVFLAQEDYKKSLQDLEPLGYDLVIDATGIPTVIERATSYIKPRGTLWIFGVTPTETMVSLPSYEIFRKDITVIGTFAVNQTFHEAIRMIESGRIQVEPLISHILPLSDFAEAMYLSEHDPTRMKIQFGLI